MNKTFTAVEGINGVVTITKKVDGVWSGSIFLHPDADRLRANLFEIHNLGVEGFRPETPFDRDELNTVRNRWKQATAHV